MRYGWAILVILSGVLLLSFVPLTGVDWFTVVGGFFVGFGSCSLFVDYMERG